MRLTLSDDQEQVRDTTRRFLETEAPLTSVRAAWTDPRGVSPELWQGLSALGVTLMGVPEALGGVPISGGPGQDLAIVAEEMGRVVAAGPFQPTVVALLALAGSADAADHAPLIEAVGGGESRIAWAYGEPSDHWDPEAFAATVRADGDAVVLSGTKAYVEGGAEAGCFVVTAQQGNGVAQVLVPAGAPGVHVTPGRSVDFVRRFAEVRFEDVRLPRAAMLSEGPAAADAVERQLQLALLLQCAETNGALERAFEFTVEYMRERLAFGRPIASFQALKHRLADMLLRIHSCMATTDAALEAFDAGSPEAPRLARIAKTYVSQHATEAVHDLVQMTGGIAVTWEHDLHLYERRIALNRALLGGPERRRLQIHAMIAA
jgi:alkylation response protein AidB-like acyl-CoA dehydrogenase